MKAIAMIAAASALLGTLAVPALAGGGSRPHAQGAPMQRPQAQQQWQHGHMARETAPPYVGAARSPAPFPHASPHGGHRLEQRPDPNHQNPYRPMFSLDATHPGEPHPYFQTRKDGFGYPTSRPSAVYRGNGVYVIPR